MTTISERLQSLNIELPDAPAPAANYVPYVIDGKTLYIAGQIPKVGTDLVHVGKIGVTATMEDGIAAARVCALNILAQANAALDGDLERIRQCVKLGGFVNAIPEFTQHPQVINGASDLMVELLGEKGQHARFAVGAGSLPLDVTVEIDAIFAID